jgi:hypothetical protein
MIKEKRSFKNNNMGFIPSDQDRTPYQRRNEYRQAVHPITLAIINDFENRYNGNILQGYSLAEVLKSFLIDYKAMINNPALDLSHWFDVSLFDNTYKDILTGLGHTSVNTVLNSGVSFDWLDSIFKIDLRYKNLIRSDLKKSPITYSLYPNSLSYKFLRAIATTFKNATAPNSSTARTLSFTLASKNNDGYAYMTSLPFYLPFATTNKTSMYVSPKIEMGGLSFGEVPWYGGAYKGSLVIDRVSEIGNSIFCRCVSNGKGTVYNNPSSPSGVYNDTYINIDFTFTIPSVNETIAIIQDAIDYISYFEIENTALNIDGNYDGIKTDAYEQMLNDQLVFLNNMTDKVEANLMQTKIDGQAQKDALIAEIEKKKIELQNAINEKRKAITKMNETMVKYNQTFNVQ